MRETATNAGYSKLSWDKIKGAKKYGIYERAYNAKGGYYKLVQTVKGTSCTYKGTEDTYVYVRAIASNSKANSQYLEVYAIRYAPQPVITGGEVDKKDGTRFKVKVKLPYGHTNDHESLMINLYRSDTKDGYYQFVDQAAVFGMMYDNSFDHDPNQYTRKKFTKDSVITLTDYSFRGNTEYYYKAVAVKGSSNMRYGDSGLDSKSVKLTTPELPVIGEEFGSAGTLYRHTDGTLAYFVDNDGNKYTEGLELERFWEGYLYYGDTEGHKFKAYKDGKVYFYDEVSGEYKKVEEGTNEG